MTELDILRSYSDTELMSSWHAMGENLITDNTKFYNQGLIYRIDLSEYQFLELDDTLVYCKQKYIGHLDWEAATIIDDEFGYITFGNDVVDPHFVVLGKYDPSIPIDESFVPFESEVHKTGVVRISDDDYMICMSPIGYPFITDEELEYSKEQIINLAIKPALQEYFHWLPKVEIQTYGINTGSTLTVPFPNGAYDIVHYSIQQAGSIGSGAVTNTLWRSLEDSAYGVYNLAGMSGSYFGNASPHTSLSSSNNYLLSRAATQGMINYYQRAHIDKFKENGQMYARMYSLKGGTAEVHWAMETLDFNDIEYAQRNNVINYVSANIKLLFANLRRQAKGDIPGQYDYNAWISESNETKEKILGEWKALVKSSGVMRGSL